MNQALYRKYRSRSFAEVVGQEHITKTLEQAIKSGRISHAYLFTGPRGVGKTSVARILAHEVNQLPYSGESVHLDIIEIDAASNRRIDEIRDLRDKVRIAPSSAKYKVYIIDEVHMLTREAFNALLKTLEEPPAHCIFILATTEAHKLPDTIISRTQRFEFRPVGPAEAAKHLAGIAKKEKIDIKPEALDLLAEFGNGSFRDSIGYLDQLSSTAKTISEDDVRRVLGLPSSQETHTLISALKSGDTKALIDSLQDIRESGISASELSAAIATQLRQDLIAGSAGAAETKLLKELVEVRASSRPYEYLEVILLDSTVSEHQSKNRASPRPPSSGLTTQETKPSERMPATKEPDEDKEPTTAKAGAGFDLGMWQPVLDEAKKQAASIYTALRLAQPSLADNSLVLSFQFPLHKKKLEQAKNRELLARLIEELSGEKVTIECRVDKTIHSSKPVIPETSDLDSSNPLHSITNVFGAAEMMES